jgi:hypothetical protein
LRQRLARLRLKKLLADMGKDLNQVSVCLRLCGVPRIRRTQLVKSDMVQGFVDPTRYMNDEERKWRLRPVMDYLGYWYMVTLSKVTENAPIVGFLPANSDENSAKLAEVMDPIFKSIADETEMGDRRIQTAAWCLAAGEAYYLSRPDFRTGKTRERRGPAVMPYAPSEADEAQDVVIDDAPYNEQGEPQVEVYQDEMGEMVSEETGDPYLDAKAQIRVDVLSPLEIRSQWGNGIPWNEKQWVIHRWFESPSEVEEMYGEQVEPDAHYAYGDAMPGTLERMLFGSGYHGASRGDRASQNADADQKLLQQFVKGFTMWEKPCPRVGGKAERREPFFEAAQQSVFLVAGKVDAGGLMDLGDQLSEVALFGGAGNGFLKSRRWRWNCSDDPERVCCRSSTTGGRALRLWPQKPRKAG